MPADWFGDLAGAPVLCLASGGGQQGPLLAAAGARVTVFDNFSTGFREFLPTGEGVRLVDACLNVPLIVFPESARVAP